MTRSSSFLGAVALALASAVACGGNAPAGEGAADATSLIGPTADACALLTVDQIAAAVGNAVQPGAPYAGPEVCKWESTVEDDVDVLLMVRLAGSIREQVLCAELKKAAGTEPTVAGVGDLATFKFSGVGGMFNSGELVSCGPGGFVSLSLNGRKDEAALRQAAVSLATAVYAELQ